MEVAFATVQQPSRWMGASVATTLPIVGLILGPVIVGDYLGLLLNCHGRFAAAAAAPLANAVVSATGLWFWPAPGLDALVWTLLAGSFTQALVVAAALAGLRLKYPFRRTGAAISEIRASLWLGLPLLPAIMLSNAMSPIVQFRAAEIGEGAVATYAYAYRFHAGIMQVLVIGVGTVLLPHFGALWMKKQTTEILILLRRLSRLTVLASGLITAGVFLMGSEFVNVLLSRGRFDIRIAQEVAAIWGVLSLSLFPFSFGTYIAKFGQALRQVWIILLTSIFSLISVLLTTYLGVRFQSLTIVSLGPGVAVTFATLIWLLWLGSIVNISSIVFDIVSACARIFVAVAPAVLVDTLIIQASSGVPEVAALTLRAISFLLVPAAALYVLGWHRWFLGGVTR